MHIIFKILRNIQCRELQPAHRKLLNKNMTQ